VCAFFGIVSAVLASSSMKLVSVRRCILGNYFGSILAGAVRWQTGRLVAALCGGCKLAASIFDALTVPRVSHLLPNCSAWFM
jgi:hypothetical protein